MGTASAGRAEGECGHGKDGDLPWFDSQREHGPALLLLERLLDGLDERRCQILVVHEHRFNGPTMLARELRNSRMDRPGPGVLDRASDRLQGGG